MADPKKLPAYLGGYDPNKPETLGYFPAFYPGQLDALASQMAQGYGAATMQPTWGGPINAANGLPMAGVPNNPALGQFGAAIPPQVLSGPTAADYRADLLKIYTPMGSAVPKPVPPVTRPPTVRDPIIDPVTPTTGGGGKKTNAEKRRENQVKRVNAENALDVAQGRSQGSLRVHNGRIRFEGWNR